MIEAPRASLCVRQGLLSEFCFKLLLLCRQIKFLYFFSKGELIIYYYFIVNIIIPIIILFLLLFVIIIIWHGWKTLFSLIPRHLSLKVPIEILAA